MSTNKLNSLPLHECSGLLYIGDPHLSERTPSRRLDEDYLGTILDKLDQAADIANENDLIVVITGDLVDSASEFRKRMIGGLFKFLRKLNQPCYCLAGNHDLDETTLKETATLSVIAQSGLMQVIAQPGPAFIAQTPDGRILVGGTPSGMAIPDDITDMREAAVEIAMTVWLTHEDLAFPGAYPNALPFKEIQGCDYVVNGHMHERQNIHHSGVTAWFNPGNIIRKTIKDVNHKPSVNSHTITGGLHQHVLRYRQDVFDKSGHQVDPASKSALDASMLASLSSSGFAELLKNEFSTGKRSDNADQLREIITSQRSEQKLSNSADTIIGSLLDSVLTEASDEA